MAHTAALNPGPLTEDTRVPWHPKHTREATAVRDMPHLVWTMAGLWCLLSECADPNPME